MRLDNVLISTIGLTAVGLAVLLAWRGRRLSVRTSRTLAARAAGEAAAAALRSLATSLSAGLVAGVLVVGLGGRLVMRLLAATSGDLAQGRATEAEEIVGEITFSGTLAFVLFVGVGAGMLGAALYVLVGRALPRTAAPAGAVLGVILLGTIGVLDPLSPDNVDFAILEPTWLAVSLVIATGLLFGTTFTALVARLASRHASDARLHAIDAVPIILVLVPPIAAAAGLYVGGHAVIRGRFGALLDRRAPLVAARVLLALTVGATATLLAVATTDILG